MFANGRTGSCTCTNTCEYANDGGCDDGGPGKDYSLCDLGTDCADCGPSTRRMLKRGETCTGSGPCYCAHDARTRTRALACTHSRAHYTTALLQSLRYCQLHYCPTALLSLLHYCPTALLPYGTTALQHYCPTAPLPYYRHAHRHVHRHVCSHACRYECRCTRRHVHRHVQTCVQTRAQTYVQAWAQPCV